MCLVPEMNSGNETLNTLFFNEQSIYALFQEEAKFMEALRFALKYYRVKTWDTDKDYTASILYGPSVNRAIEKEILHCDSLDPVNQYLAEYFIDSAMISIFQTPDLLMRILVNLHEEEKRHLLTILFSHPYFDYSARKIMSQDDGLIKMLPEGFWLDKIKMMQQE